LYSLTFCPKKKQRKKDTPLPRLPKKINDRTRSKINDNQIPIYIPFSQARRPKKAFLSEEAPTYKSAVTGLGLSAVNDAFRMQKIAE